MNRVTSVLSLRALDALERRPAGYRHLFALLRRRCAPASLRSVALANPRPAEGERGGRPAIAARELGLVGDPAMLDAIGKAGVCLLPAEMEVGLAGMADRPFADAVVEIEQRRLVGDFGARLGRNQPARRRRRDRRLLIARALADEAAGADRAILQLLRGGLPLRRWGMAGGCLSGGRGGAGRGRVGPGDGFRSGRGWREIGLGLRLLLLTRLDRRRALLEAEA